MTGFPAYKHTRMKKLVLLSIFISTTSLGQFFETEEYVEETPVSFSKTQFFNGHETYGTEDVDPHPGDEDPAVPIDDWLFLLPLAGIAIGCYHLQKRAKHMA